MSITIGSDPEFGLVDQYDDQVSAYLHLPDDTRAEIGCDGHNHIGELRPKHGDTPREHLDNIAGLIRELDNHIPDDVKVVAGSTVGNDAIGGHIHFGDLGKDFPYQQVCLALDYFLALPVALIEVGSSARYRRRETGYGQLSAYRQQNWGFEYRTLPSWLVGYGVALAILSVGYTVVDAVKQGKCPPIPSHIPDPDDFNSCSKGTLRPLLSDIKKGWRRLPLYPKFRLEIAYLNHLLVHKKEWLEKDDIRLKWHSGLKRRGKPTVFGNPQDDHCARIAQLVGEVNGISVFVYGLSAERDIDIMLSQPSTLNALDPYTVHLGRVGRANIGRFAGWLCVGLGPDMRQNADRAASLIRSLAAEAADG